jgi:hypothetical protein
MDWQQVTALAIVVVAVVYLARQSWKRLAGKRTNACGACSHCRRPAPAVGREPQVIGCASTGNPTRIKNVAKACDESAR